MLFGSTRIHPFSILQPLHRRAATVGEVPYFYNQQAERVAVERGLGRSAPMDRCERALMRVQINAGLQQMNGAQLLRAAEAVLCILDQEVVEHGHDPTPNVIPFRVRTR
jgi:hypothetical protein